MTGAVTIRSAQTLRLFDSAQVLKLIYHHNLHTPILMITRGASTAVLASHFCTLLLRYELKFKFKTLSLLQMYMYFKMLSAAFQTKDY